MAGAGNLAGAQRRRRRRRPSTSAACRRCRTPCPRRRSTAPSRRSAARSLRARTARSCHGPGIGAAVADERPAVVGARLEDVDLVAAVRAVLVAATSRRCPGAWPGRASCDGRACRPPACSRRGRQTGCPAARCHRRAAAAPCRPACLGSCALAAAGRDEERAVAAERDARRTGDAGLPDEDVLDVNQLGAVPASARDREHARLAQHRRRLRPPLRPAERMAVRPVSDSSNR